MGRSGEEDSARGREARWNDILREEKFIPLERRRWRRNSSLKLTKSQETWRGSRWKEKRWSLSRRFTPSRPRFWTLKMRRGRFSAFQGLSQFGRAYQVLYENDCHAPGSVDRLLADQMIRLCKATRNYIYKEYTPHEASYVKGSRPTLDRYLKRIISSEDAAEALVEKIVSFTSQLSERVSDELDEMLFGGTEEEILHRGSDWCTDVARVACALCQVAGIPSRWVILADLERAYSSHVIIETHRGDHWGVVDPLTNVIYRRAEGKPASAWDLMNRSALVDRHYRDETTPYAVHDQFGAVAVSNYFIQRHRDHSYTVSNINDYYRLILDMSGRGWPGGLRWLYEEDHA